MPLSAQQELEKSEYPGITAQTFKEEIKPTRLFQRNYFKLFDNQTAVYTACENIMNKYPKQFTYDIMA